MAKALNFESKQSELRTFLMGVESATARDMAAHLGVSQPVISRLVARLGDELVVSGKARATRYALHRDVEGVGRSVPIYEVSYGGETRRLATLHAVHGDAFYVEMDPGRGAFYPGLPYFLHDMRPAGFLGRLLPARHPHLQAPADILLWSDNDCLRYFTRYGWDLSGNLLVGDVAFQGYLQALRQPPDALAPEARSLAYIRYAEDVLESGAAGSSAGGEQPKFLATVMPERRPVLVKFSPPVRDPVGRRVADLLWCEHLMHGLLAQRGYPKTDSEIVQAGDRVFLQVQRFDRGPQGGRRGMLSLAALDLQFVGGNPHGWVQSVAELARLGELPQSVVQPVRWLAVVGRLIANNDMHGGNLAFFTQGLRPTGLTPIYDMLPMLYAPYQGNLPSRRFTAPLPTPQDLEVWDSACETAMSFWQQVVQHPAISPEFRDTAAANGREVERVAQLSRHLPRS